MKILRKLNRISAPKLEASRSNFIFVVFIFFMEEILYVGWSYIYSINI